MYYIKRLTLLLLLVWGVSSNSLSLLIEPCRNPFMLHDVYFLMNDQIPTKDDNIREFVDKCGIPSEDIKSEYEQLAAVKRLRYEGIYPSTYMQAYNKIQEKENLPFIFENEGNADWLFSKFLEVEEIQDLEELKYLAETKSDEPLKGNDLYFYKFPSHFFESPSHTIFTLNEHSYTEEETYVFDRINFTARFIEKPELYMINKSYFDYSVFYQCLGEDQLDMCMKHQFIFMSYLQRLLANNIMKYELYLGGELSEEEVIDEIIEQLEMERKVDLDDGFFPEKGKLLQSYTQNDFLQYLKRGAVGEYYDSSLMSLSLAKSYKDELRRELEIVAFTNGKSEITFDRQKKLDYLYFDHFEKTHPDRIQAYEYENVSKFYYGREDIYKSLYDLEQEQGLRKEESSLYYSVLYYMLFSNEQKPQEEHEVKQSFFSIHQGKKVYAVVDLPQICQLYHESLDKALQGATEERRKAFEEKNIQVCEM